MLLYEPNAVLGIRSWSHFFYQWTFFRAYLVTIKKTLDAFIAAAATAAAAAAAATAVIVHVVHSTAEQFFGPLFSVVYSAKQWRVDQEIKMFT